MNRFLVMVLLTFPLFTSGQTFEKSVVAANGERIGFLEFRPSDYSGPKHPLIIFLHGIGEKGNGTTQLKNVNCCGIPSYIRGGNKMRFTWQGKTESFIVLSPQLSKKYSMWQPFYTDEMIRYAKANLNIDPNRIFVTGLSMGGGGTWNFASSSQSRAEQLAGIAPVVAPCMMSNGCNIAKASLPVLAIHVWDDKAAPAACTINAIRSINDCHPSVTPNLIMYAKGGHYVWVHRAFDTAHAFQNPNIYEWFLAQNKTYAPNKKPLARAGADQSITTADGSISLSAANSSDPDGSIVRYIWSKLSGPNNGTLTDGNTAALKISGLSTAGKYKYQLKVVDNRAEWSMDTVVVNVEKGQATPNTIPLARAGSDTSFQLPANSTTLSGTSSIDPDGNITAFLWTKVSGPDSYTFADPWNASTLVTDLIEGVYTFRLKVSDNRGASSTDDVEITVKKAADTIPPSQGHGSQVPEPIISAHEIILFPNPAGSSTTLALSTRESGSSVANIYDNMGRLAKRISFVKTQTNYQEKIFIGNLERGLYFVDVLVGRNLRFRAKLVKQ